MRLYILRPLCCKTFCTSSCICCTPTLRLKITATDPAFRWCRSLVLVLLFSLRKCGGKMAFFGAVNSSELSSHENYYLNWKGVDKNLRCSDMLGPLAFRWLNRKICLAPKYLCTVGLCSKMWVQLVFWESVSFHREMFCRVNFGKLDI